MMALAIDELPQTLEARFEQCGIAIVEHALLPNDMATIERFFPALSARVAGARADRFSPDARQWLAGNDSLNGLASTLLKCEGLARPRLTRIQALDKSPGANWFVPWHQDRAEDGVERDPALLQNTIALRIHLDDCDEDNGPLEVIPGSHHHGRLESSAIAALHARTPPLLCLAVRGDIVAMRPLLVHRSQRARRPRARRVLHLEYVCRAQ